MKREILPDIDIMEVGAKKEHLAMKGEPIMLQLCAVPAYALTVHKTQVCLLCFDRGLESYVSPRIFARFPPRVLMGAFLLISKRMDVCTHLLLPFLIAGVVDEASGDRLF